MKQKAKHLIMFLGIISIISAISMAQVRNPILPGFYPDPSICRVGNDYYLVNSTFSYFPGVPVFHSTDLVHWKQIGHVLDRPSQLKLIDQHISGGIYAPTIRYHEGTFYMITTLIGGEGGNFFVTAKDPAGPWSEPVWLREIDGIDPSFFFDKNGKVYVVNNGPVEGNKPLYEGHTALWLQEFDLDAQKLTGPRKMIVNGGTDLSKKPIWIEGPHFYQNKGFYYLMAAEGGTETGHSEVIFRSKSIWGPFEVYEGNPILTQRDLPDNRPWPVTCTGHADLVQTQNGEWVSVFLACQPYSEGFFNTGRQTFILPVNWSDDWPVILEKGKLVPEFVDLPLKTEPGQISFYDYSTNWKDEFEKPELAMEWNFIRTPYEKWYELKDNFLVINARPVSISEVGNPSFIGRRLQFANSQFTTSLKLEQGKDVEAGVVVFQNEKFYYKFVIQHSGNRHYLSLSSANKEFLRKEIFNFKDGKTIYLRMNVMDDKVTGEYSLNKSDWIAFGPEMDGKILSTKLAGGFVGAYFGLYAFGKTDGKASFDWASAKKMK